MISLRTFPFIASILLLAVLLGELPTAFGTARQPQAPSLADVAGSYYRGDGLGVNHSLKIEADGTFSFRWDGCLGNYARSAGTVARRGGGLSLRTTSAHDPRGLAIPEGPYLPVRWGDRHYLIPADDVMSFVNEVNLGSEPRDDAHGMHYLRQDDWKLSAGGFPDLPESYRGYLLEKPIEGAVLSKEEGSYVFKVAVGLDRGLVSGMELVAAGGEGEDAGFCELKVLSVAGSTAVVESDIDPCDFLHPGDPVSTSLASLPAPIYRHPGRRWGLR